MIPTLRLDDRAVQRTMTDIEKRQMPFAASRAINDTTGDIRESTERSLPVVLDNPTPFTKKGMFTSPATKRKLEGVVGFKPIQSDYLVKQEEGGIRLPKRKALLMPVGMRLNQYGNMTRNAVKTARSKPNTFSGKIRGVGGIWQRTGKNRKKKGYLKLLVAFRSTATYRKRLGFEVRAIAVARLNFAGHMTKRLAQAVRTAK